MLKYLYITNNPAIADICISAEVDYIFVDMEYMGKDIRQAGLCMVSNHHTIDDIVAMRRVLDNHPGSRTKLLARINPIHEASQAEIEATIAAGADAIMLPMWKTTEEVRQFLRCVRNRAEVFLLMETRQASEILDEVLQLDGIDRIHIGLNDLHLSYGQKFLFEPLANGQVEALIQKITAAGIPCGFGGIAQLGQGMLPAERILAEHIRLGSDMVILSRAFCNTTTIQDLAVVREQFFSGLQKIRDCEQALLTASADYFEENMVCVRRIVKDIVESK